MEGYVLADFGVEGAELLEEVVGLAIDCVMGAGTGLEVEDEVGFLGFYVLEAYAHDDFCLVQQSFQLLAQLVINKNTRNGHLIP